MALSLTGAKLIAMVGQMAVLTFFCLLPIKVADYVLSKGEKGQIFLSCCRCFGGGALLGLYMLHMTPEIRYLLEVALLHPQGIAYPVPEAIAGAAFFGFLFLEYGVNRCDRKEVKKEEEFPGPAGDVPREPGEGAEQIRAWLGDATPARATPLYALRPIDNPALHETSINGGTGEDNLAFSDTNQNQNNNSPEVVMRRPKLVGAAGGGHLSAPAPGAGASPRQSYLGGRPLHTDPSGNPVRPHSYHSGRLSRAVPPSAASPGRPISSEPPDGDAVATPAAANRSLILLIALSADGLFQGMAVGLQRTNAAVWSLFIAVVSHEFIVAFCLGLELVRSKPTRTVVISALVYGATPAVGTAIGIAIYVTTPDTGDPTEGYLLNGILQSIATGVFLYVAFVGILGEELTSHPTIWALLSVLAGYLLMAGVAALHGHGEEPEEPPP